MGTFKKLLSAVCALLVFWACKENKLTISKAGDFAFRRSYSEIQFRDISDQELESIRNSNPMPMYLTLNHTDSVLMLRLQRNGILDSNYHLIRSKFPETVPLQFTLTDQKKKELQISITDRIPGEITNLYNLVVTNKKQKIVFELEARYGGTNRDISYQLADLIPGGYPEIIILNEYYIMNGDNSDIYIYEVTE